MNGRTYTTEETVQRGREVYERKIRLEVERDADGAHWADVCLARVRWHERERPARVLVTDAPPLLGMALVHGGELRMACLGGGEVVSTELGA